MSKDSKEESNALKSGQTSEFEEESDELRKEIVERNVDAEFEKKSDEDKDIVSKLSGGDWTLKYKSKEKGKVVTRFDHHHHR